MKFKRFRALSAFATLSVSILMLTGEPNLASALETKTGVEYTRLSTGAVKVGRSDRIEVALANVGEGRMNVVIEFYDERGQQRKAVEQSLGPGESANSVLRLDDVTGTWPRMLRAVIDAQTVCPPSGPGGFVARGTHHSAQTGTIDAFAACPVVVCSGLPGTGRHNIASGCVLDSSQED